MNTNLLISVVGVLVTNWTGHIDGTNEIGVVKSNTVAQVEYGGVKHELLLKSEHTMRYVLRECGTLVITNSYKRYHYDMTNYTTTNLLFNQNVEYGETNVFIPYSGPLLQAAEFIDQNNVSHTVWITNMLWHQKLGEVAE